MESIETLLEKTKNLKKLINSVKYKLINKNIKLTKEENKCFNRAIELMDELSEYIKNL